MRSTLAPYYVRLERMLAGMLTRKPVRLTDVSDVVTEQLFDVDLQGNDLNVWTYETARKCVRYGHVGVLVDAPAAGASGRPYWVTYTPRDILGWRVENADGKQNLTQLRLMERVVVPDGLYGEKKCSRCVSLRLALLRSTKRMQRVISVLLRKARPASAKSRLQLRTPTGRTCWNPVRHWLTLQN